MGLKLYTINTVNNFMELIYRPFVEPFARENQNVGVYNIMDDSLLSDTISAGGVNPVIASRVLRYAKSAESSGADGVLVTCTSINRATELIRPLLSIPILNIEEPVAEAAVQNGTRVGILATLSTSPGAIGAVIGQKARAAGKRIELISEVVDGAFAVLCAGDRERHDRMVCEALYRLAERVDVIAFAQISMSLLEHEQVRVPVYKIGRSGLERILQMMSQRSQSQSGTDDSGMEAEQC